MKSINDNSYGYGGFVYLGDIANCQSFKPDPKVSYFKDGVEDVAHLYPVIQSYKPSMQDLLTLRGETNDPYLPMQFHD